MCLLECTRVSTSICLIWHSRLNSELLGLYKLHTDVSDSKPASLCHVAGQLEKVCILKLFLLFSPQHLEARSGRQMFCLQLCFALGQYCFPLFFPLSLTLNEYLCLYSCSVNTLVHGARSCFGFCRGWFFFYRECYNNVHICIFINIYILPSIKKGTFCTVQNAYLFTEGHRLFIQKVE